MSKRMAVWGLGAFLLALAGTAPGAEIKLVIADDGKVMVMSDKEAAWQMNAGCFSPGWKMSKDVKVEEGYPKKAEGKSTLRFGIVPPEQEGVVNVTLTVAIKKDSADFHYTFEVPKKLTLNGIFVSTRFPVGPSGGKTLRLGGQDIELPVEHTQGKSRLFAGSVEHATYPIPGIPIELTTDPDTSCLVQDVREWGDKKYELRLELLPGGQNQEVPAGTKIEKHVVLRIPGLTSSSVGAE